MTPTTSFGALARRCVAAAFAAVAVLLGTAALAAEAPAVLVVGEFSAARAGGALPSGWKPLTFDKIEAHTAYTLVESDGAVVLQADSRDASSGVTREIAIDPNRHPIVEWRWKIANVLDGGDVTRKSGDDYPARLYITFAYDRAKVGWFAKAKYEAARLLYGQYPPLGALNYIWASQAATGTVTPNPYTERVQMIVLQSGAEKVGQWVGESRNIRDDYRAAFGHDAPMISGVAVMTDTDNTHESARAWFGDIVFKAAENAE
ncbi:MAG: DUF3047 domain-containing protein [bacterium]